MRVQANFDGGSRGNPGPAAAAAVLRDEHGEIFAESTSYLGSQTNNHAEYSAMLLALDLAVEKGANEIDLIGDSELVIKQLRGEYKVKHPDLKPLHAAAREKLKQFDSWTAKAVKRDQNKAADALVNQTLDSRG